MLQSHSVVVNISVLWRFDTIHELRLIHLADRLDLVVGFESNVRKCLMKRIFQFLIACRVPEVMGWLDDVTRA